MSHVDAPAETAQQAVSRTVTDTRLHGRWLLLTRIGWGVLVVFSLVVFVISLPVYFAHSQTICTDTASFSCMFSPESAKALLALGLSVTGYATLNLLLAMVSSLVYFVVAFVLVLRKSDDWMAMLVGLMLVMQGVNNTSGVLQYGSLFWAEASLFVNYLGLVLLAFVLALFPDGHFVPRWIRWFVIGWTIVTVPTALPLNLFSSMLSWLFPLYILLWFVEFLGLAGAQLYRYFRVSSPLQRQQTKWVVFSLAIVLLLILGFVIPFLFFPSLGQNGSLYQVLGSTVTNFLLILFPLSLAIAILRYRLWDIDILINRTLVYGTLTVILTGVYVGLVIGLQALLRGIISQDSGVAIVISTLAIAGLFQPLRRRIQRIIDRRFYRSKYDAAKTLAAFSTTLRQEVDLEQLREHLLTVVQETMQPSHVSLWLRPPEQASKKQTTWSSTPPAPQDGEEH
jgi:hypothetical protein